MKRFNKNRGDTCTDSYHGVSYYGYRNVAETETYLYGRRTIKARIEVDVANP